MFIDSRSIRILDENNLLKKISFGMHIKLFVNFRMYFYLQKEVKKPVIMKWSRDNKSYLMFCFDTKQSVTATINPSFKRIKEIVS